MVEHFKQGKLRWVNMKNPTISEIQKVMAELNIPAFLMTDLTTPVPKSTAVKMDDTIKITLDFPVVKRVGIEHQYEVKFFISKNSLLTVQYEEMEGIDRFKRQFEVATTLRKNQKGITGVHLFTSLMNHLYDAASSKLDYIESKLSDIEDDIVKSDDRQMVLNISSVSKKLITFRHILHSHDDVFRESHPLFSSIYGETFSGELKSLQGQYFSLQRRTNALFDTLTALRETNTALLTTRQNEIIKNLTIMAFITFPLTLLSSMFGMNVTEAPIIGKDGDFWIIVGIMVTGVIGFFAFFKHKRWI